MKIRIITFLIFTCLISNSIAQIKDNSQPGLWEISINIKDGDKILADRKVKKCLSKEYLAENSSFNIDNIWDKNKMSCKVKDLNTQDNHTSFSAVCIPLSDNKIKEINIKTNYFSDKEKNITESQYITQTGDNKRTVTSIIKGARLGDCQ